MTTPRPASPETHALLARRARTLAGTSGRGEAPREVVASLVARRGGVAFAVRAVDVRDVRREARVTPLPGADRPVAGLVAWRGQGLVVHDVLPGAPIAAAPGGATAPWLLVVGERRAGERGTELALLADEVDDIVDLDLAALVPAPEGAPPSHGATSDGMLLLDLRGWIALHPAS